MHTGTNRHKVFHLIVDIEEQLRRQPRKNYLAAVAERPFYIEDIQEALRDLQEENKLGLQKYVQEILEKNGPVRTSGKIDTVCFYESCSISASTWSNFLHGRFSKETILKIITGLRCDLEAAEHILKLAGFCLTDSRMDRIIMAAVLSGHNNSQDMYEILDYYAKQYPKEVKNYYVADL